MAYDDNLRKFMDDATKLTLGQQIDQRNKSLLGMQGNQNPLNTPTAQDAFQQSFPQPQNGLNRVGQQMAPVPQLQQPKKNYMFREINPDNMVPQTKETTYKPEEYKDGTADGLGRNFLSETFKPKEVPTEESENETTKRILAVGNALRHIGNIVNTTRSAPSQTFNDPVALADAQYQQRRALREAEQQRKEAQAYKQAQMDYQNEKLQGDKDYKDFLLQLKLNQMGDAKERNKALDDYRKEQQAWREQNAKDTFEYRKQKDKEDREFRAQVHADNMANQAANRALRMEIHNSKGSGSGSGSGKAVLPTQKGYLARKTNLNNQDLQSLWSTMVRMGMITKKKADEFTAATNQGGYNAVNVIRNAIAWGAQHSPAFVDHLKKHYGFSEVVTEKGGTKVTPKKSSTPVRTPVKTQQTPTVKKPVVQKPTAQQAQKPAAQQVKKPAIQKPAVQQKPQQQAQKPAAQKPVVKKPTPVKPKPKAKSTPVTKNGHKKNFSSIEF